jgi:hypothetical protein
LTDDTEDEQEAAKKHRRKAVAGFLQGAGKSRREARAAVAAMERLSLKSWYIVKGKLNND